MADKTEIQPREQQESNDRLIVAGTWYGINPTGKYVGRPIVQLSVSGCNLLCGNPSNPFEKDQEELEPGRNAKWVCHSISEWKNGSKMTPEEIFDYWKKHIDCPIDDIGGDIPLVIGGGEPLLPDTQDQLTDLFDHCSAELQWDDPDICIRTNGTFEPSLKMRSYVDHFEVSIKLPSSGMKQDHRIDRPSIKRFVDIIDEKGWSVDFQFVAVDDRDLNEIKKIANTFNIPKSKITVYPPKTDDSETVETLQGLIMEYGFRVIEPEYHQWQSENFDDLSN